MTTTTTTYVERDNLFREREGSFLLFVICLLHWCVFYKYVVLYARTEYFCCNAGQYFLYSGRVVG